MTPTDQTIVVSITVKAVRRDANFDPLYQQDIDNGAEIIAPMQDYPWGFRTGIIANPFEHRSSIGKQAEVLTLKQVMHRMAG